MFQKRRLWVAALIIAVVVVGGFVLFVPRAREIPELRGHATTAIPMSAVTFHDSFAKGVHTITGSIIAPNVCSSLTATGSVDGQDITLALTMPEDTQICLQVATKLTFSVLVKAVADASITDVSVNGVSATTSRI